VHEYVRAIHDEAVPDDAMTVGEMVEMTVEEARQFLGEDGDGMSMAFNFDHMRLDFGPEGGRWSQGEWTVRELKATITRWQNGLEGAGWNSLYLNNHDEPRMVSRFGDDGEYRRTSAKLLGTLTHTLKGTPYIYQGEELGMTNYPFESLEAVRDVDSLRNVEQLERAGRFTSDEELLELVRYRSRDNARTPMQWSADEHAGFTSGEPWIPVNPNHDEVNVDAERADGASVWHYYRDLVSLRDEDVFVYGRYDLLLPDHESLWVFTRTLTDDEGDVGEQTLTVLNMASEETRFEPPASVVGTAEEVVISNYPVESTRVETETLRPWEARVYRLV
jgi:glycosidase